MTDGHERQDTDEILTQIHELRGAVEAVQKDVSDHRAEVRATYVTKADLTTMSETISLKVYGLISGQVQSITQDAIRSLQGEKTFWAKEEIIAAVTEYDRTPAALDAHRWKRQAIREEERRERREDMQAAMTNIYTGASRVQKAVLWAIPFLVFLSSLIGLIGLIRAFGVWQWLGM